MHARRIALVAVAAVAHLCAAAGTMQLSWTTDLDDDFPAGTFGPDGPWQAVGVFVGDDDSDGQKHGVPLALWPSAEDCSFIPTAEWSGNYSVDSSSSASRSSAHRGFYIQDFNADGSVHFDTITFSEQGGGTLARTNGSVIAADEFYQELPNGKMLNQSVGILGLGPTRDEMRGEEDYSHPSLLEQLKADRKISTASYSLHVGSVALDQPGSLILGGYEQNRVIGQPGVFSRTENNTGLLGTPFMYLLDVVIGVEIGDSPFDSKGPISVYSGLNDKTLGSDAKGLYERIDNPPGSVLVTPNPAVPYIYLPPGTCEQAQRHLPVRYYPNVGFYLWDTSDPQFSRIVTSPAYLGFILSDMTGANITIKVPFALLNLTLTPPLVSEPMTYFPCMNAGADVGVWSLGRAFLQAAFLAVDFKANHTYLAQAAGPGMTESVIKEFTEDDFSIEGSGIGLADSWEKHWTVLPGEEDAGGGLSAGAIAGIVVGVVVVLGAVAAVIFWRRRSQARETTGEDDEKSPPRKLWGSWWKGAEAQGNPVAEMEAPNALLEAPGKIPAHEMAAISAPVEMPASPVR